MATLLIEGAVTSRGSYKSPKNGKEYLSVKMTDTTSGEEHKFSCERPVWDAVPGMILKAGKWQLSVVPNTFGNQDSTYNVTAISPVK